MASHTTAPNINRGVLPLAPRHLPTRGGSVAIWGDMLPNAVSELVRRRGINLRAVLAVNVYSADTQCGELQ